MRIANSRRPRLSCYAFVTLLLTGFATVPQHTDAATATEFVARADTNFTRFFQRTNGWTAGDGASSIPLSDGRVLWLFGDSHLDDLDPKTSTMPCLFQARNAGMLQQTNDFQNPITLAGKSPGFRSWFRNSTNANEWFWPL